MRHGSAQLVQRLGAMKPSAVRALKDHYLKAETTSLAEYARYEAAYNVAHFDASGFGQEQPTDAGR